MTEIDPNQDFDPFVEDTGVEIPTDLPSPDPVLDPLTEPPLDPPPDLDIPTPVESTAAGDGLPHGPGHDEDLFWQPQSENGFCVPMSVATILTEFTGSVHTEPEVVAAAVAGGWLEGEPGAWQGMNTAGAVALLEHYGVDAHSEVGTVAQLEDYLDEGRAVILSIDSSEVWEGRDDDVSATDSGADHAVRITAIDEARGVAILQDPGHPEGQGDEVPLQTLEDAWRDSNNEMVVTDAVTPQSEALVGPETMVTDAPVVKPQPAPQTAPESVSPDAVGTPEEAAQETSWLEYGAVILPVALSVTGGAWVVRERREKAT